MQQTQNVLRIVKPEPDSDDWWKLKDRIWTFLDRHDKMILGYTNNLGEPVQSLMLYTVNDDMDLFIGTLKRFPKYEALVQNPPLSVVVQGEGEREKLQALTIKAVVLEEISEQDSLAELKDWFVSKNSCKYFIKDQEDFVMFKIKPLSLRLIEGVNDSLVRYDINL